MKKAIFIILFLLPIFLMVTISVTGRFIKLYVAIPVEGVYFANSEGEEIFYIEISKGQTYQLNSVVYPEYADNKKVTYSVITNSQDPVCSLNGDEVTGLEYGSARIFVTTEEKKLQAELEVMVVDKYVTHVLLSQNELTLNVGATHNLTVTILPYTALDKRLEWHSSDTSKVSVNQNGQIFALAPTQEPVTITVTSIEGGISATCEVTVNDVLPALAFYRPNSDTPLTPEQFIIVNSSMIDLKDYLKINSADFTMADVEFIKVAGNASLSGSVVIFAAADNYITVVARVVINGQVIECYGSVRYRLA